MQPTEMGLARMKLLEMEAMRTQIRTRGPHAPRSWALAIQRLEIFWRFVTCRIGVRRQPKTLSVRESVALGDRRFVSVIQFERQRFLIGCSSAAVTLVARLPDAVAGPGDGSGNRSGEKN